MENVELIFELDPQFDFILVRFNIPLEFFLCPASFKFFISQPVFKIFHYFLE
jgi:hypothetical protein